MGVTKNGGTKTINVTAATGCAWTATSNTAWLTINSGMSGSGNGTVSFNVARTTATATRTGTLTVGGQTVTVSQITSGSPNKVKNLRVVSPTQ